jgi:uncharacterized protein
MEDKKYDEFFLNLVSLVKEEFRNAPGCHDWDHTERVLRNSQIICAGEKADPQIVETAVLLHDISRPDEMKKKGGVCHAEAGAARAEKILRKFGLEESFVRRVRLCVANHRYRGKNTPETIEEKIVYDADKLDSIGATGVGRAFHFAGRIGARLHNTEEEALRAKSYSREDSAYREYLVKLRHVPEKMLTKTGRKLARRRASFIKKFFDEINREM